MASGSRSSGSGGNNGIIFTNNNVNAGAFAVGDNSRVVTNSGSGPTYIGSRHTVRTVDPAALRSELRGLLRELDGALRSGPAQRSDAAGRLTTEASQLVEAATRQNPDPSLLQQIGRRLKQTAPLLNAVPRAVKLTDQILGIVSKLHGLGL